MCRKTAMCGLKSTKSYYNLLTIIDPFRYAAPQVWNTLPDDT